VSAQCFRHGQGEESLVSQAREILLRESGRLIIGAGTRGERNGKRLRPLNEPPIGG